MGAEARQVDIEARQWLERAAEHYHACLLHSPEAQDILRKLGIYSPEIITAFRIGCSDGTLTKKLAAQGRQALKRIGLLSKSGSEVVNGCLILPLLDPQSKQVINLYAYHFERSQHLFLPGGRRGIFNPQAAQNTDEVIITGSVIDAALLWSIGTRYVIPAYADLGLTNEIIEHLVEHRIRRVVLLTGEGTANCVLTQQMQARLAESSIELRIVELPAKDASTFVINGGTSDDVRRLITEPTNTLTSEQKPAPQVKMAADGSFTFNLQDHEYRIRGLSPKGLDRLKVNVRLTVGNNFHLDTLDLYHARARFSFAQTAAKLCGIAEKQVSADLLSLIERLESMRLEMRSKGAEEIVGQMTPQERDDALTFLHSPDLCERIVEEFRRCGFVGARSTVLTAYLAAVSRKLSEPLAVLIVARSGAGKSVLQDALCAFVPPEETVRVTRQTGQALF
ncbi:MAG: hypothetical protein QOE33_507 [Acidobacteriota bacterium]|nr:hypothetical protein [Acidobacteriota bacterium]